LLRYVEGELGRRGLVARLAPLLALVVLTSTEISFTLLLAGGTAWLLALWLVPAQRTQILSLLAPVAGAYAIAAVATSPFLYYVVTDLQTQAYNPPDGYSADLLNYVVPTFLSLDGRGVFARLSSVFPGNPTEQTAYIGVPALAIAALYARSALHTAQGRFILVLGGLLAFAALGSNLYVHGHAVIALPWSVVDGLPLFDNVLPVRLSLYTSLVVATVVALWMAARPAGKLRWLLPLAAVATAVPNPGLSQWSTTYSVAPFFTRGMDRSCIAPGEIVLPLPIGEFGDSMLWQVDAHFRFAMAGGRVTAHPPARLAHPPAIATVAAGKPVAPGDASVLAAYVKAEHVGAVIVDARQKAKWEGALDRLGPHQTIGGVLVYDMTGKGRRCSD
jgi:hypothetical protein